MSFYLTHYTLLLSIFEEELAEGLFEFYGVIDERLRTEKKNDVKTPLKEEI